MTNSSTIKLHINRFCSCDGCIVRIKRALVKVGGAEMLEMDPETGNLTVLTAKPPELIQYAVKEKFKKRSVSIVKGSNNGVYLEELMYEDVSPTPPPPTTVPSAPPLPTTNDGTVYGFPYI